MIVGLHDPRDQITNQVRAYVGDRLVVAPSAPLDACREIDPWLGHLADKELLLRHSTHIVIEIVDIASFSILISSLRLLLAGSLMGIIAIGPVPREVLFNTARNDGVERMLEKCLASKRFMIVEELNLEVMKEFFEYLDEP